MQNNQMIYAGFDPSFIDILVNPISIKTGNLLKKIPELGTHHTNTNVELRPGGNGFNLCRTLASFGRKVTFVGPVSPLFESLVQENEIGVRLFSIKDSQPNYTIILNLLDGEIQFNSVESHLSFENLTRELLYKFQKSPVKSLSNIALNKYSIEWISSLLLSLVHEDCLPMIHKAKSFAKIITKYEKTTFEGIMLIDPSDISDFTRMEDFGIILEKLKLFEGKKYLSVNEYEMQRIQTVFSRSPSELADYLNLPIILHTSKFVEFYGKENLRLETKKLQKVVTFVGAGDCFNGSLLHFLLDGNTIEDSLKFAIKATSYLIETGKYPSENDTNNK
ncbi:MAG: PfkB family carbohydrate kinase [Candidatus Heimdallarchaeaceae archaeon]